MSDVKLKLNARDQYDPHELRLVDQTGEHVVELVIA